MTTIFFKNKKCVKKLYYYLEVIILFTILFFKVMLFKNEYCKKLCLTDARNIGKFTRMIYKTREKGR